MERTVRGRKREREGGRGGGKGREGEREREEEFELVRLELRLKPCQTNYCSGWRSITAMNRTTVSLRCRDTEPVNICHHLVRNPLLNPVEL